MRILGSSIEPSWLSLGRERSQLRNIDMCATRSGLWSKTARRTLNLLESSLLQTWDQLPQWHERINKASPSIVILRTVTAFRVEKFCVDFKIINTISISISISIWVEMMLLVCCFIVPVFSHLSNKLSIFFCFFLYYLSWVINDIVENGVVWL